MFVGLYIQKTNQRFIVGIQFHINRLNGVEKIVNEKKEVFSCEVALGARSIQYFIGFALDKIKMGK